MFTASEKRWACPSCWDDHPGVSHRKAQPLKEENAAEKACAILDSLKKLGQDSSKAQPYGSSQHFRFYFEGMKLGIGFNLSFHPSD
jgi:hypothetical protein